MRGSGVRGREWEGGEGEERGMGVWVWGLLTPFLICTSYYIASFFFEAALISKWTGRLKQRRVNTGK